MKIAISYNIHELIPLHYSAINGSRFIYSNLLEFVDEYYDHIVYHEFINI